MNKEPRRQNGESLRRDAALALGRRIRAHRKRVGLTQAEVAERVGVDPISVRRWELGLRIPSWRSRAELLRLFDNSEDLTRT